MDNINHSLKRPSATPIQKLSSNDIQRALSELFVPQLVKDFEAGEEQQAALLRGRLGEKQLEGEFIAALEMVRRVEMAVQKGAVERRGRVAEESKRKATS